MRLEIVCAIPGVARRWPNKVSVEGPPEKEHILLCTSAMGGYYRGNSVALTPEEARTVGRELLRLAGERGWRAVSAVSAVSAESDAADIEAMENAKDGDLVAVNNLGIALPRGAACLELADTYKPSGWVCYPFGSDIIRIEPREGAVPAWPWRFMQWLLLGFRWVREEPGEEAPDA